ncbi:MAG: GAF domain-containing protein [Thermaerobacterales bacterium]
MVSDQASRHDATLKKVGDWAASNRSFREVAQRVVEHLRATYPAYSWVGIYMIEGQSLHLWAWDGPAPTQHTEIPLHAGVCGWAASTGSIANVPDVTKDDRYLQCFLHTRSEVVVPIKKGDQVFGEIDIDSDQPAAFSADDEAFLTRLCAILADQAETENLERHRLAG